MILVHYDYLPTLPDKLLLSLHRNVCKIRSNDWKNATPASWYYNLSWATLVWYHKKVLDEMILRGWKPSPIWQNVSYHGRKKGTIQCLAVENVPEDDWEMVYPYNDKKIQDYINKWSAKHNA